MEVDRRCSMDVAHSTELNVDLPGPEAEDDPPFEGPADEDELQAALRVVNSPGAGVTFDGLIGSLCHHIDVLNANMKTLALTNESQWQQLRVMHANQQDTHERLNTLSFNLQGVRHDVPPQHVFAPSDTDLAGSGPGIHFGTVSVTVTEEGISQRVFHKAKILGSDEGGVTGMDGELDIRSEDVDVLKLGFGEGQAPAVKSAAPLPSSMLPVPASAAKQWKPTISVLPLDKQVAQMMAGCDLTAAEVPPVLSTAQRVLRTEDWISQMPEPAELTATMAKLRLLLPLAEEEGFIDQLRECTKLPAKVEALRSEGRV